jgi:predicted small metal-binding protein
MIDLGKNLKEHVCRKVITHVECHAMNVITEKTWNNITNHIHRPAHTAIGSYLWDQIWDHLEELS